MNSIKDMVDVNTIIGEPIETINGTLIIPVSKVGFGFAAGGSEFTSEALNEYNRKDNDEQIQYKLPFGGGSGAGVSISPIAFLVIQEDCVKLLHVDNNSPIDKLLDYVPDLIDKANNIIDCKINNMENKKVANATKEEKLLLEKKKDKDKKKNVEIKDFEDEIGKIR